MIISCPQCSTKYRLSKEKVKSEGTRVRCSRCGHEFTTVPADDLSATFGGQEKWDQEPSQESHSDQDPLSDAPADEQAGSGGGKASKAFCFWSWCLLSCWEQGGMCTGPRSPSGCPFFLLRQTWILS